MRLEHGGGDFLEAGLRGHDLGVHDLPRIYDAADSILAQKLAQVEGVGQVTVGGGAKPAVRVELNPRALFMP